VGAPHGRFRIFLFATPSDSRGIRGLEAVQHDGCGSPSADWRGVPDQPDRDALRAGPDGVEHVPGQLTLLPTPAAQEPGGTPEQYHSRLRSHDGRDSKFLPLGMAVQLLPTPRATRGGSATETTEKLLPTPTTEPMSGNGHARHLGMEAQRLLPTPRATDGTKGGPNQRGSSGDLMLPSAVAGLGRHDGPRCGEPTRADIFAGIYCSCERQDWREYEPAIRRWESLTRPAPLPTEPGNTGKPRLSPLFVEWLMGLPAGHVTDPAIGISRNDQLKALGNGVVPQQCAAALRAFLADTAKETAA
jgi:DNA (cytosine-5)-methyltransferase 1